MIYRIGDIVGVADDSWLSKSIRRCTGDGPVSHIQMIVAVEPAVFVVEALEHVVINSLDRRLGEVTTAYIMSPPASTQDRDHAVLSALPYLGRDYGYNDIALQLLDSLGQTRYWTEHFAQCKEPICSMLVALCYPTLFSNVKSVTPNDIYNLATKGKNWQVTKVK